MRSRALTVAALSACVALGGCATTVDAPPVLHIEPAAAPSVSRPLPEVLPTAEEMTTLLGAPGFLGPLVDGGPDALLAGVGEADATPVECVGPAYRLQQTVYRHRPVLSVASQSWAGGSAEGPSASGFFGVVRFATPDDARAFMVSSAENWHRCNGATLVLQQAEHGANGSSRITDVSVDDTVVSAVVMRDGGTTIQRALGVVADYVVDVEISDTGTDGTAGALDAVAVADLMLQKVG
ncbi:sensor domain-containing protein [Mycolicibacterium sp. XJ1819]